MLRSPMATTGAFLAPLSLTAAATRARHSRCRPLPCRARQPPLRRAPFALRLASDQLAKRASLGCRRASHQLAARSPSARRQASLWLAARASLAPRRSTRKLGARISTFARGATNEPGRRFDIRKHGPTPEPDCSIRLADTKAALQNHSSQRAQEKSRRRTRSKWTRQSETFG